MFDYSNKLPNPSSHNHQVTIRSLSDGYQLRGIPNYGLRLILYHQFRLPYNKQFHFIIPQNLFNRYELYSKFDNCYHNVYTTGPHYCYILGWNPHVREISGRNLSTLVLDPYWKLINIHDKYSGEVIDHIMISEELSKTIYASLGYLNKVCHYNNVMYLYTVEPLLKDTPNKRFNTFDLSLKDKFYDPYSIMATQSYLLKRTTSL